MKAKFKIRNNALFRGGRVRGMAHKCVSIVRHCSAFSRRCGAFLCVVLLVAHLALFPVRVRATAGALAAVAGVTVLGAYLMASGVYPYISEAGQSLSEWTSDNLQPLIDKYNAYLTSIGNSYQIVLNGATPTVKGYMTQGSIVMANDVWNRLRDFVQWIQSEYALTDNQTGVQLGVTANQGIQLPSVPDLYSSYAGDAAKRNVILADGFALGNAAGIHAGYNNVCVLAFGDAKISLYYVALNSTLVYVYLFSLGSYSDDYLGWIYTDRFGNAVSHAAMNYKQTLQVDGVTYTCYRSSGDYFMQFPRSAVPDSVIIFDTVLEAEKAFLGLSGGSSFSGVVADTMTVSPLEALPADTPWGGLAAQGTSNPVKAVEQGIAEREKPVVRPVEVEIGAGTEVDSETGEVTENPVVISPSDVSLAIADYALPASITTVFPFSLPWDFARILEALRATPEPISLTLSFPHYGLTNGTGLTDEDFSFQVVFPPPEISQNETFSDFMSWFRNIELIAMCVAATWGIASFIRRG